MRIKAEIFIPITFILHFILWYISLEMYKGEISIQSIIGEALSSWAVTVFAYNFLMATRARWIEKIFGGLDKMYIVHRKGAIAGVIILILHWLIVPKALELTAGKPMGFIAMVLIIIGVIISVAKPLKKKIKYPSWLKFHKLMGVFYTVGVLHSFFVVTKISEMPVIRTYVYLLAFIGIGAWIYKAFLRDIFLKKPSYSIQSVNLYRENIVEINMRPDDKKVDYKPGQFAFFSFNGIGTKEAHPFTISSHPSDLEMRIIVKDLGDYTKLLNAKVEEGMSAKIEGPYGMYSYRNTKHKKQLWLAGGIGITPFLSFLKDINDEYNVQFVWSVNQKKDAFCLDEITDLVKNHQNITFVLHETKNNGHYDLTNHDNFKDDLSHSAAYICGPETMRKSFIKQLRTKGVSPGNIYYEEFSFR